VLIVCEMRSFCVALIAAVDSGQIVKLKEGERYGEREPIMGVWAGGPGAEPLVRGSGAKPSEAEDYFASGHSTDL